MANSFHIRDSNVISSVYNNISRSISENIVNSNFDTGG